MTTVSAQIVGGIGPAPIRSHIQFTLGSTIGSGQGLNSDVFLAHDLQLDTQLAMKRVPKTSFPSQTDYFAEARRLYDARHKHIVEVKYSSEDADHIYLAMPFYRAGTLQGLLDRRHLTVGEVIRYGLEFLAGLNHVHVKGLVHLDVKPTNILLDDSDTAALADFGLSREVSSHGLAEMPRAYRRHLPPERMTSDQVTKAADVYQAGLTLYRLCVGTAEFERQVTASGLATDLTAISAGRFPDRRRFLPHTPARLRAVIRKALEVQPSDRYRAVLDLMNALALVDTALDWTYNEGAQWGEGTWRESGYGTTREVEVTASQGTWNVSASRVGATGHRRHVRSFCKTGLSEADARRVAQHAFTDPWR